MRFIVINDQDGDIVAVDAIKQVLSVADGGSAIWFKGSEDTTHSPLSAKEIHIRIQSTELLSRRASAA